MRTIVDEAIDLKLRSRDSGIVRGEDGSVTVFAPVAHPARGSALLVPAFRDPDLDGGGPYCTRCGGRDLIINIEFPGDGEPLHFCRSCLDRSPGHPITVRFKE